MNESYIQQLFAERIGGRNFGKDTAIYKFEKIKRAKRAALEANPGGELFDLVHRRAGAFARRRLALDLHGRLAIVALKLGRSDHPVGGGEGGKRTGYGKQISVEIEHRFVFINWQKISSARYQI